MLLNVEDSNVVLPDSELGLKYGFNSKDFDGYLWLETKDIILISAIISWNQHKGNFRRLVDKLREDYTVVVMHPGGHMKCVCTKYGMHYSQELDVCYINKIKTSD